MNTNKILKMVLAGVAAASLCACSSAGTADAGSGSAAKEETLSGQLSAAGSTALQPLAEKASDQFGEANPDLDININGGGSGEGLKQVSAGSVDIGMSDVFAEEKLDADKAKELTDNKVCVITMAAVVNKSLGVTELTLDQLTDIYTGKITNWKEVNGPDKKITVFNRKEGSGTRALFEKYAFGGQGANNDFVQKDSSGDLVKAVEQDDSAIGYVAISYLNNNDKIVGLKLDGAAPTLDATYDGSYPVWGYEHLYTKGEGSEAAQAFIKYMTSDEFSSKVEDMGYGVVASLTDAAKKTHAD